MCIAQGPWHVTAEEPYDSVVSFEDGGSETYSTMERPKLIFNGHREPVAIINGVSPTYPCSSCKGPLTVVIIMTRQFATPTLLWLIMLGFDLGGGCCAL